MISSVSDASFLRRHLKTCKGDGQKRQEGNYQRKTLGSSRGLWHPRVIRSNRECTRLMAGRSTSAIRCTGKLQRLFSHYLAARDLQWRHHKALSLFDPSFLAAFFPRKHCGVDACRNNAPPHRPEIASLLTMNLTLPPRRMKLRLSIFI